MMHLILKIAAAAATVTAIDLVLDEETGLSLLQLRAHKVGDAEPSYKATPNVECGMCPGLPSPNVGRGQPWPRQMWNVECAQGCPLPTLAVVGRGSTVALARHSLQ